MKFGQNIAAVFRPAAEIWHGRVHHGFTIVCQISPTDWAKSRGG